MSGEMRLTKSAVIVLLVVAAPASLIAGIFDGTKGIVSVAIAIAIVLANAVAAAGLSTMAGRFSKTGAAMISLPSFGLRMAVIVGLLELIKVNALVVPTVFAATFGAAVALVLFVQARTFRRTPWLALTFGPKEEV